MDSWQPVNNYNLVQATEEAGGNVLLVGHAATLDTCSRQLVGREPRQVNELMSIVRKVRTGCRETETSTQLSCCRCPTAASPCWRRSSRRTT